VSEIRLSRAVKEDRELILRWRNHPSARKNFFNAKVVSAAQHRRWYKEKLLCRDTVMYVASAGEERIGVIRFEKRGRKIDVSVNLAPEYIGKGFGSKFIALAGERYFAETKETGPIEARIKKGNIASEKAFLKAGYKKAEDLRRTVKLIGRPSDVSLCEGAICIRPLTKRHINSRYLKWLNDTNVTRFLSTRKASSKDLINFYKKAKASNNSVIFAIELRGRHIGNVKLDIDWRHNHASLGIMIGDKLQWGKGYGSRAVRLASEYCFDRLGLSVVILGVIGIHKSAIKAYKKAGFKIKGRIEDMLEFEGRRADKVIMGIDKRRFEECRP